VGLRYSVSPLDPCILNDLVDRPNRVSDSDGDFLLIEAAESLPTWISPSNSQNRVRPSSYW
jgi:hypothetical protein